MGDAIEHLAAAFAGVASGNGLQISQCLLAEAALVGLGPVLQQPVERFRQVADLQGGHGEWAGLQTYPTCMRYACVLCKFGGTA